MKNTTQNLLSFSEWAKNAIAQHSDILQHMRNSSNPLDRAIAERILVVGGAENA